MKLTKTTTLENMYASSDYECFCFDKHQHPREHDALFRSKLEVIDKQFAPAPLIELTDDLSEDNTFEKTNIYIKKLSDLYEEEDKCRIYPRQLLPEGINGKKGRWTITVTFESDDE